MDIKLRGHKARTEKAKQRWIKIKVLYDSGVDMDTILDMVRKPNGKKYERPYIYEIFEKLKKV